MATIPTIKSGLFKLRPFRKGDECSLQRSINSRNVTRHTISIPYPYTMKHAKDWIAKNLSLYRKKKKTEVNFAIDIGGEVAGGIGLRYIEGHKAELGYWLSEKYWGKGIMTEAVKLVSELGFKKLKLHRVYVNVHKGNKASARVLEKAGFKLEGINRKNVLKDGRIVDSILYAKVK